jgi:DNA-binding GntR family transcriptional regulator
VSITTLSREHGYARQTCSKALGLLVGDGLLFRVPGLGYRVPGDAAECLARK